MMKSSHWRFHHIGLATKSVESFLSRFGDVETTETLEFEDSVQGVFGKFIEVGGLALEVMEPLNEDPTLDPWLMAGNRIYQIAFEVDDLDSEIRNAQNDRIRVVREPHPAAAFNGRRVAFLMPAPGLLIELIESS
jgi:methylmalonyl-CoA/ethylmalonyl-CoA epimerase